MANVPQPTSARRDIEMQKQKTAKQRVAARNKSRANTFVKEQIKELSSAPKPVRPKKKPSTNVKKPVLPKRKSGPAKVEKPVLPKRKSGPARMTPLSKKK